MNEWVKVKRDELWLLDTVYLVQRTAAGNGAEHANLQTLCKMHDGHGVSVSLIGGTAHLQTD